MCNIEDANPLNASKIRWIKKSKDGSEIIVNETSSNQITWISVERSSSANYSCTAHNDAGWSDESNAIELDIKYLPSSATIQQINANYPVKGDQLILECIVHHLGSPTASQYIWEQDGFRLEDEHKSILNISTITLATKGNYSCSAVSSIGLGGKGKQLLLLLFSKQKKIIRKRERKKSLHNYYHLTVYPFTHANYFFSVHLTIFKYFCCALINWIIFLLLILL